MAQVYSEDRPLFASGPQTPLYKSMQEYAAHPSVQELLQKLCSDLFTDRPEDALAYIAQWAAKETQQRELEQNEHK